LIFLRHLEERHLLIPPAPFIGPQWD